MSIYIGMKETVKISNQSLIQFLSENFKDLKHSTIKKRLKFSSVLVNDKVKTRANHLLKRGDVVRVLTEKIAKKNRVEAILKRNTPESFEILYQDDFLVAINKPAGLLSVSNNQEQKKTALALLRDTLKNPREPRDRARLWPCHRLDRDTSGVMLFAKVRDVKDEVQASWNNNEKMYYALVSGIIEPSAGIIDMPLWEDKALFVHVGDHPKAKKAITHYQTLATKGGRKSHSLVEIKLETGRKHQIRVHMAHLGHAILGDSRYEGPRAERLGLHAFKLRFYHPILKKQISVEAPLPKEFVIKEDMQKVKRSPAQHIQLSQNEIPKTEKKWGAATQKGQAGKEETDPKNRPNKIHTSPVKSQNKRGLHKWGMKSRSRK